jgi:catechol 2,3-dioxygenase-like lactoylglutathione lyase family enzyme
MRVFHPNTFQMNLNQITVPVLDVEKAIAFYEIFGLQLIVKSLPHYARFVCPKGNATFSLHQVDALPNSNGIWVYFEVDDVDAMVASLQDKGLTIDEMPADKSWLWREARLKDIDGNQLIIYHAGTNRIDPPWKIK